MFILHFSETHSGAGYGFMQGKSEYIVLLDYDPRESDIDIETEYLEPNPGFELTKVYDTDIDVHFNQLPMERNLVDVM